LAGVIEKYSPQILAADGVTSCLLILDEPVGYMQYYPVSDEVKGEYGLAADADAMGLFAFDQFIGAWGHGQSCYR